TAVLIVLRFAQFDHDVIGIVGDHGNISTLTKLRRTKTEDSTMSSSDTTTNHETIQKWVEARDGRPSVIRTKGKGGMLRIDVGEKEANLEEVGSGEVFKIFDENKLALRYQRDTKGGETRRFNKFIDRP